MNDDVDYGKVLDELVAEREKLDMMINWIKLRLGRADVEVGAPKLIMGKVTEPMRFPRIATDAFFRMSVSEGIKAFLRLTNKKPQTARAITDALVAGGLRFKAKNPYQTVFPTLSRMASEAKEIDKLPDGTWGLAEWYSSGRREAKQDSAEEK
jgi:hypothetical protein